MSKKITLIGLGTAALMLTAVLVLIFQFCLPPMGKKVQSPLWQQDISQQFFQDLARADIFAAGPPVILADEIQASISGVLVRFAKDKDLSAQIRTLQLLLPRIRIDGRIKEVDLRFNKVVIRE